MERQRLDGSTIAITGATSGIGFFAAEGLAQLGAKIILVGRSAQRGSRAIAQLPHSKAHRFVQLDLTDIDSTRAAGARLGRLDRLDGLVMNAGQIAAASRYRTGPFGVEATVAVNVLAHLELMRWALPALSSAPRARIVSVGSMLTRRIPFDPDNWLAQLSYRPRVAYAMSRHTAEILGFELDRRLRASRSSIESVVTHPGGAIDALTPDRVGIHRRAAITRATAPMLGPLFGTVVHGKEAAAQPIVAALAVKTLPVAAYIGPSKIAVGEPVFADPVQTSRDPELGRLIWAQAEELLRGPILASPMS